MRLTPFSAKSFSTCYARYKAVDWACWVVRASGGVGGRGYVRPSDSTPWQFGSCGWILPARTFEIALGGEFDPPAGEIFGTCKNLPQTLSARTELPRCKKKATYIIRSKFEWACSGQRAISVVQIRLLVEKFTPAPGYLFTLSKAT